MRGFIVLSFTGLLAVALAEPIPVKNDKVEKRQYGYGGGYSYGPPALSSSTSSTDGSPIPATDSSSSSSPTSTITLTSTAPVSGPVPPSISTSPTTSNSSSIGPTGPFSGSATSRSIVTITLTSTSTVTHRNSTSVPGTGTGYSSSLVRPMTATDPTSAYSPSDANKTWTYDTTPTAGSSAPPGSGPGSSPVGPVAGDNSTSSYPTGPSPPSGSILSSSYPFTSNSSSHSYPTTPSDNRTGTYSTASGISATPPTGTTYPGSASVGPITASNPTSISTSFVNRTGSLAPGSGTAPSGTGSDYVPSPTGGWGSIGLPLSPTRVSSTNPTPIPGSTGFSPTTYGSWPPYQPFVGSGVSVGPVLTSNSTILPSGTSLPASSGFSIAPISAINTSSSIRPTGVLTSLASGASFGSAPYSGGPYGYGTSSTTASAAVSSGDPGVSRGPVTGSAPSSGFSGFPLTGTTPCETVGASNTPWPVPSGGYGGHGAEGGSGSGGYGYGYGYGYGDPYDGHDGEDSHWWNWFSGGRPG